MTELEVAPEDVEVLEIDSRATHELRRRVLRRHDSAASVRFDGDDEPTTLHLGARRASTGTSPHGHLPDSDRAWWGVSSWYRGRPGPIVGGVDVEASRCWQLRGMAVDDALWARGLGSRLLHEGLVRLAEREGVLVWARARDTALGFYQRHGFVVVGTGYVDDTTGLDHHDIWRRVTT